MNKYNNTNTQQQNSSQPNTDGSKLNVIYNDKIKFDKVKVINEHGECIGLLLTRTAIKMALDAGLDLVLVNKNPPIAKITDYGKFAYNLKQNLKAKAKKIRENTIDVKNIIIHLNIDKHDLEQKFKKIREFIADGCNVKFVLQLRGRESSKKDVAMEFMNSCISALSDICDLKYPLKDCGKNIETTLIEKK